MLAPARFGGLERVVHMLASGHRDRGHAVSAVLSVTPSTSEVPLADTLRDAGVDVRIVRLPARDYRAERRAVAAACAAGGARVVHTHGYRADVLHGAFAPAGVRSVSTVHGFTGGTRRNRAYEWVQERALGRVDAVVGVSGPIVDRLREAGVPSARLHLCRNAFAPTEPLGRDEARARLGLGPARFVVGWVGRLSHEKGPDLLPDILAALPADVTLAVVGDGPLAAGIAARAAALGVSDRLHMAGARGDAPRLARAFDAFLLSSRTEGTPIALLEAMHAGVPAVATRVGGVPDVLVDGVHGRVVGSGDVNALVQAIVALRADPAGTARRVDAARRRIAEAFAPAPWLDWYEALYARLAPPVPHLSTPDGATLAAVSRPRSPLAAV